MSSDTLPHKIDHDEEVGDLSGGDYNDPYWLDIDWACDKSYNWHILGQYGLC